MILYKQVLQSSTPLKIFTVHYYFHCKTLAHILSIGRSFPTGKLSLALSFPTNPYEKTSSRCPDVKFLGAVNRQKYCEKTTPNRFLGRCFPQPSGKANYAITGGWTRPVWTVRSRSPWRGKNMQTAPQENILHEIFRHHVFLHPRTSFEACKELLINLLRLIK